MSAQGEATLRDDIDNAVWAEMTLGEGLPKLDIDGADVEGVDVEKAEGDFVEDSPHAELESKDGN